MYANVYTCKHIWLYTCIYTYTHWYIANTYKHIHIYVCIYKWLSPSPHMPHTSVLADWSSTVFWVSACCLPSEEAKGLYGDFLASSKRTATCVRCKPLESKTILFATPLRVPTGCFWIVQGTSLPQLKIAIKHQTAPPFLHSPCCSLHDGEASSSLTGKSYHKEA